VQQLLHRLKCLDDDPSDKPTKDQSEAFMRRAGQHTLQNPRRGEPACMRLGGAASTCAVAAASAITSLQYQHAPWHDELHHHMPV
jgi:hypothetical protein